MTGYGRGESNQDGFQVVAEIRGVNRRQSEIVLHLPRELECLEPRLRALVVPRVARGRCEVRVTARYPAALTALVIHEERAAAYAAAFRKLADSLSLKSEPTLELLTRCPGVLDGDAALPDVEQVWGYLEQALQRALEEFDEMRDREGSLLLEDLDQRIRLMQELIGTVRQIADGMTTRYRDQLLARVHAAGLDQVGVDDDRLLKEIVLFADRCDLSEELARLESHFAQFADCRQSDQSVGRKLDFLAQEMNREINTIGSKAIEAGVSQAVVLLKTELERFREQAQNIE